MTVSRLKHSSRTSARAEPDFEKHKAVLQTLYLDQKKSREDVARYMKTTHHFEATKYQYERIFGNWGWSKNIPSKIWDIVCRHLRHLETRGQAYEVFYYTQKLDDRKIRQEMKRRSAHYYAMRQELAPLPTGVAIISTPADNAVYLTQSLPFLEFEANVRSYWQPYKAALPLRDATHHYATRLPLRSATDPASSPSALPLTDVSSTWTVEYDYPNSTEAAYMSTPMQLMSPLCLASGGIVQRDHQVLCRRILYFISNNIIQPDFCEADYALHLFCTNKYHLLSWLLDHASHFYTSKALFPAIFGAAINCGDAKTVKLLLGHKNTGIHANTAISHTRYPFAHPLLQAIFLQHKDVVDVLCDHGACLSQTLNSTQESEQFGAAPQLVSADSLILNIISGINPNRMDKDIFNLLYEASGGLGLQTLNLLIIRREYDCLRTALADCKKEQFEKLCDEDFFEMVIMDGDEPFCCDAFSILASIGHNLDCNINSRLLHINIKLIDLATRHGLIDVVQLLHEIGAIITTSTVQSAIESKCCGLVRFVLQHVDTDCLSSQEKTAWVEMSVSLGDSGREITGMLLTETQILRDISCRKYSMSELTKAVEAGTRQTIEFLLERKLTCVLSLTTNALWYAIQDECSQRVAECIELGADVLGNCCSIFGDSPPLLEALTKRKLTLVKMLLDAGADPNQQSATGARMHTNAFVLACEWGNRDVIKLLFDAGMHPSSMMYDEPTSFWSYVIETIDLEFSKYLLDMGLSSEVSWYYRNSELYPGAQSPLAAAVRRGDLEFVRYLLDCGAEPYDNNAFLEAVKGRDDICDLILERHHARYPRGDGTFGTKALIHLIDTGNFVLFTKLIRGKLGLAGVLTERQHPRSFRSPSTYSGAIRAAKNGDTRFLTELLRQGCSPEQVIPVDVRKRRITRGSTKFGCKTMPFDWVEEDTAFMAAIDTGNVSVIRIFIQYDADVNFSFIRGYGRTPLQWAAERGHHEVVQMLIRANADVNARAMTQEGGTAIQLAARGGFNDIIELLLAHGADVDLPPRKPYGRTALEEAAEHGRLDTIVILLNAGAAKGGTDRAEIESAIEYARYSEYLYICELLENYLASGQTSSQLPADDLFDMFTCINDADDEMIPWDKRAIEID